MINDLLILIFFILLSISNKSQLKIFGFYFVLVLIKYSFTYLFASNYILIDRFIVNNTSRIVEFLLMSLFIYKIYKDRRTVIPVFILSSISVVYFASIIFILYNNWNVQNIIYNYRYFFGALVVFSFIDYGNKFYDKLFNSRVFSSKLVSNLFNVQIMSNNKEVRENNKWKH